MARRFRLSREDESRLVDSIERFDVRWRLPFFSDTFGEPPGEPMLADCLRLNFFCFSLLAGGNKS